jgi:hypothetical protein
VTDGPGNGPRRDLAGRIGDLRPTLAVVEAIALESRPDPYLSLASLAAYSSCSVRWLRDRLMDPQHPLPCYRLPGGKILVRRSAFDAWLDRYRRVGHPAVDRVVADVLGGLR